MTRLDRPDQGAYRQAGQALAKQGEKDLAYDKMRDYLLAQHKDLARYVRGGVKAEAICRYFLVDYTSTKGLPECSYSSIWLGLLACAVTGLEPGRIKGEAYLVPFKGVATFVPGWRGLVKNAKRSRDVKGLHANVVYAADKFALEIGSTPEIRHTPAIGADRGELIGAYAVATLTGNYKDVEWIDAAELAAKFQRSTDAWRDWPDEMRRKAPLRRLCKRLPMGDDYYLSTAIEDASSDGDMAKYKQVIDVATDGAASESEIKMATQEDLQEAVRKLEGP